MGDSRRGNGSLLLAGDKSSKEITSDICRSLERKAAPGWWLAFSLAVIMLLGGIGAVAYQLNMGIGTWGQNNTVGWAFDITNFVFWIGLGHAGTFISAILFLLRQKWRTSVGRSAEAVTIFAVICAAVFPLIHMGRPWLAFWMFPYPNFRGPLWVNFRSPLVWDFFAIATYFTISLLFWYLGLLPDFATIRDRTSSKLRKGIFRFLSFGWDGSCRTWFRYETVYLLLAGLATALVISVHSIVSWDFATSIIPGWHSTIFGPYFVVGAIFSGMAMVLSITIIARRALHLEDYITLRHIDLMSKILIFGSLVIGVTYVNELFFSFFSDNEFETYAYFNRAFGSTAGLFLMMVGFNVLAPQLLWIRRVRNHLILVFIISVGINIGMWLERFVIIVGSLHRDFLPSSWATYSPTLIEILTLIGSFGLFLSLFLLFCRFFPIISMNEIKLQKAEGLETDAA